MGNGPGTGGVRNVPSGVEATPSPEIDLAALRIGAGWVSMRAARSRAPRPLERGHNRRNILLSIKSFIRSSAPIGIIIQ